MRGSSVVMTIWSDESAAILPLDRGAWRGPAAVALGARRRPVDEAVVVSVVPPRSRPSGRRLGWFRRASADNHYICVSTTISTTAQMTCRANPT